MLFGLHIESNPMIAHFLLLHSFNSKKIILRSNKQNDLNPFYIIHLAFYVVSSR